MGHWHSGLCNGLLIRGARFNSWMSRQVFLILIQKWQSGKTLDVSDRRMQYGLTECGHSPGCRLRKRRFNSYSAQFLYWGVAQLAERGSLKPQVVGSYPTSPATDAHSKLFKEQSVKLLSLYCVQNFIWVGDVHGWRAGLKNRKRWFDSTLTHHRPLDKAINTSPRRGCQSTALTK